MTKKISKNQGFTIIETLIYLVLFGILIGGAVVAAYSLLEGNGRNQTQILMQEEGNFLISKISWALSGAKSIEIPTVGSNSEKLSVTKWSDTPPVNPVIIELDDVEKNMTISKNDSSAIPLNNSDISVSNLSFFQDYAGGTSPQSVRFSFTLTGKTPNGVDVAHDFSGEKFIRK